MAVTGKVVFRQVGAQKVLFSEPEQRVLELNDTAALIWCLLESGADLPELQAGLVARGIDEPSAVDFIGSALAQWRELGFLAEASPPSVASTAELSGPCRTVALAGITVHLQFSSASGAALCEPLLRAFGESRSRASLRLHVFDEAGRARILRDGGEIAACEGDALVPALKEMLTNEILTRADYELAMHAASLVRDRRMLLVCGPPGAGKSTLAVALEAAGFALGGDDLALIDAAGQASGVPFAATLKPRAWKLVAGDRPDIAAAPVFRRADGKQVRYLPLACPASTGALPVAWVVFLQRQARTDAALDPVGPVDALRQLVAGAFAPDRRLSAARFDALLGLVKGAASYRLTYSQAGEAVEMIEKMCGCPPQRR